MQVRSKIKARFDFLRVTHPYVYMGARSDYHAWRMREVYSTLFLGLENRTGLTYIECRGSSNGRVQDVERIWKVCMAGKCTSAI